MHCYTLNNILSLSPSGSHDIGLLESGPGDSINTSLNEKEYENFLYIPGSSVIISILSRRYKYNVELSDIQNYSKTVSICIAFSRVLSQKF